MSAITVAMRCSFVGRCCGSDRVTTGGEETHRWPAKSVRERTYVLVMNPRRQGDLGEFSAIEWLGSKGYPVWIPIGHSPDYDLVAEIDARLLRIQVKTATFSRKGRFHVS